MDIVTKQHYRNRHLSTEYIWLPPWESLRIGYTVSGDQLHMPQLVSASLALWAFCVFLFVFCHKLQNTEGNNLLGSLLCMCSGIQNFEHHLFGEKYIYWAIKVHEEFCWKHWVMCKQNLMFLLTGYSKMCVVGHLPCQSNCIFSESRCCLVRFIDEIYQHL